jgi:hypothetical protein
VKPDPISAIADAVLYEGYVLWPYRRSALKNQRRFTFGGVYPPAHSDAHPDDRASMRTEVLMIGGADASVEITVRFLHVVARTVGRRNGEELELVDELIVGDERYLTWDEATEREVHAPSLSLGQLRAGYSQPLAVPAGREQEDLADGAGDLRGALIRTWKELRGEVQLSAVPLATDKWRLSVTIRNVTPFGPGSRQEAIEQTLCSTHTLLRTPDAGFVSLADPPDEISSLTSACRNVGTWPVLVGEPGDRSTMLSSPIILEDYPRIAPESPGDLFDGGEIDQLLILNILSLTDEEKAEMAASDPRTREILERTEALTPDQLMALHGSVREFGMAR